jgi:hypothetical protein
MPVYSRLSADLHKVPKDRRTRNAHLRHDDAAPTEADIMADLDEVIETRASTDHRISR